MTRNQKRDDCFCLVKHFLIAVLKNASATLAWLW